MHAHSCTNTHVRAILDSERIDNPLFLSIFHSFIQRSKENSISAIEIEMCNKNFSTYVRYGICGIIAVAVVVVAIIIIIII